MKDNPPADEQVKTVAVVGLGSIGGGIAGSLCAAGQHDVIACTRRPLEHLVLERPEGTVDVQLHTLSRVGSRRGPGFE